MDDSLLNILHHNASEAFVYFDIPIQNQRDLVKKLTEKHRFYHNYEHINDILKMVDSYSPIYCGNYDLTSIDRKILLTAALYHDAIYDPISKQNEEKSAEYFLTHCSKENSSDEIMQVTTIIKDTANHVPSTKLSQIFCDFDLRGLKEGSFYDMMVNEKKIFLEFQRIDYSLYKQGRIDFLQSFFDQHCVNTVNIIALIDYVKFRVPKIGILSGTFNPFHKGHMSILEKAEKIFDKVIIAKGFNPEKRGQEIQKKYELECLQKTGLYYRQVEIFEGLITDYISAKSKDADITLIRGLRNGNDLSYEMNQIQFIREFDPNIKSVFIHCDKEYEHISSSALRSMLASGDDKMILKAKSYCEI